MAHATHNPAPPERGAPWRLGSKSWRRHVPVCGLACRVAAVILAGLSLTVTRTFCPHTESWQLERVVAHTGGHHRTVDGACHATPRGDAVRPRRAVGKGWRCAWHRVYLFVPATATPERLPGATVRGHTAGLARGPMPAVTRELTRALSACCCASPTVDGSGCVAGEPAVPHHRRPLPRARAGVRAADLRRLVGSVAADPPRHATQVAPLPGVCAARAAGDDV